MPSKQETVVFTEEEIGHIRALANPKLLDNDDLKLKHAEVRFLKIVYAAI